MMGWGDYVLGTIRQIFSKAGVGEARMHTDHQMVLAELRGERAQRNGNYRQWRRCCPIKPRIVRPLTEGEAEFATLKREVERAQWPTSAQ